MDDFIDSTKGRIKACQFEIIRFYGDEKERRVVWKELSRDMQKLANFFWRMWVSYHTLNNTAVRIDEDIKRYNEWLEATQKEVDEKNAVAPKGAVKLKVDKKTAPKWRDSVFPITGWKYTAKKQARKKDADGNPVSNPATLVDDIYHAATEAFPNISPRVLSLALNKWSSTLKSKKSASGSLPGWVSILFGNEQIPSFSKPQPIPFDTQCGPSKQPLSRFQVVGRVRYQGLVRNVLREDGNRLTLLTQSGGEQVVHAGGCEWLTDRKCYWVYFISVKLEKSSGELHLEQCEVIVGKKQSVLDAILSGDSRFCGSQLVYSESKNKWFVKISFEYQPEIISADENLVMIVRPGRSSALQVLVVNDGVKQKTYGVGRNLSLSVSHKRMRIERERLGRSSSRMIGQGRKSHGRTKAQFAMVKLTNRWNDFVKSVNNQLVGRIIKQAKAKGVGKIVYIPPRDVRSVDVEQFPYLQTDRKKVGFRDFTRRIRDTRLLASAGTESNEFSREGKTSWNFYEFGNSLGNRLPVGIEFVKAESGKVKAGKKSSRKVREVVGK